MTRKVRTRHIGLAREYVEDTEPNQYASPPCYMHEVDPAYFGLDPSPEATRLEGNRTTREPSKGKRHEAAAPDQPHRCAENVQGISRPTKK